MNDKPYTSDASAPKLSALPQRGTKLLRLWWLWPVLFVALLITIFFMKEASVWMTVCLFALLAFSGIMQLVTFILAIVRKQWRRLIGTIVGGLVSVAAFVAFCIMLFATAFARMFGPNEDSFGKEHPIPDNVQCELPLVDESTIYYGINDTVGELREAVTPVIDSLDTSTFLQIHYGMQPGIYEYDFYYPQLPDGHIYLKCFEVTTGVALSTERIAERSRVDVASHNTFGKIANRQEFTIYEGDWGDYYAVRVEVWHHEDHSVRDTRLLAKTYRMEGWMR